MGVAAKLRVSAGDSVRNALREILCSSYASALFEFPSRHSSDLHLEGCCGSIPGVVLGLSGGQFREAF